MLDYVEIQDALERRRDYISRNIDELTMRKLRKLLEEDMGLQPDTLRAQENKEHWARVKDFITQLASDLKLKEAEEKGKKSKGGNNPKEKQAIKKEAAARKQARVKEAAHVAREGEGPKFSKRVEKMRKICKSAGIAVPPNTYRAKHDPGALEDAFAKLLGKHGLGIHSDAMEIRHAKEKIQKEKDLEGIDLSNIVEGSGRGGRRRATVNYREVAAEESEEEEEEEEEGPPPRKRAAPKKQRAGPKKHGTTIDESSDDAESDAQSDADSDVEAVPRCRAPAAKKRAKSAASEEDEEEEAEESVSGDQEEAEVSVSDSAYSGDSGDNEDSPKAPTRGARKRPAGMQDSPADLPTKRKKRQMVMSSDDEESD